MKRTEGRRAKKLEEKLRLIDLNMAIMLTGDSEGGGAKGVVSTGT